MNFLALNVNLLYKGYVLQRWLETAASQAKSQQEDFALCSSGEKADQEKSQFDDSGDKADEGQTLDWDSGKVFFIHRSWFLTLTYSSEPNIKLLPLC